jgi:mevalonate kinase
VALELFPRAQACGKVILLGEHSVVYGYPALAAGLPDSLTLTAEPLQDRAAPTTVRIEDWGLDLTLSAEDEHPVVRACLEVLGICDGPLRGWAIEGRSQLPAQAGLGSSAALSVALARLVLGPEASDDDVVEASLAGERVFHGQPSGIDSEVAARGGLIRFVRGEPARPVVLRRPMPLLILPTGVLRSTADQVAKVRALHDRFPALARPILDLLGVCVGRGVDALGRSDFEDLGCIMSIAHELLSALGVSSPVLDELCSTARMAGALGAKLTGAGQGGCVLALPPADPAPMVETLEKQGHCGLLVQIES